MATPIFLDEEGYNFPAEFLISPDILRRLPVRRDDARKEEMCFSRRPNREIKMLPTFPKKRFRLGRLLGIKYLSLRFFLRRKVFSGGGSCIGRAGVSGRVYDVLYFPEKEI